MGSTPRISCFLGCSVYSEASKVEPQCPAPDTHLVQGEREVFNENFPHPWQYVLPQKSYGSIPCPTEKILSPTGSCVQSSLAHGIGRTSVIIAQFHPVVFLLHLQQLDAAVAALPVSTLALCPVPNLVPCHSLYPTDSKG